MTMTDADALRYMAASAALEECFRAGSTPDYIIVAMRRQSCRWRGRSFQFLATPKWLKELAKCQ